MLRRITLMLTLTALVALIAAPAVSAAPPARSTASGSTTQTLLDGTVIESVATITNVAVNSAGQLVASGDLTYTVTNAAGALVGTDTTQFTNALLDTGAGCDILTLDIGAIFLDLLGLQVDIAPISIDITAVPGAGNLLGNLLCAVAGLLDGPSPLGNLINRLLGILNGLLA
jgi:hypothetical protein